VIIAWLGVSTNTLLDLVLGTPEENVEDGDQNETRSLSTNDVLEPAFRQNPLVDNDYVFGQALGRYCKPSNANIHLHILTLYHRVHGPCLVMGILQKSPGLGRKASPRSKQRSSTMASRRSRIPPPMETSHAR
jgi:hypothetical protein